MAIVTNKDRANNAREVLNYYREIVRGDDCDAIADLICDLCHEAQRQRRDVMVEVQRGLQNYICETYDDGGMSHEALTVIQPRARPYRTTATPGEWKPWKQKGSLRKDTWRAGIGSALHWGNYGKA